MARVQTVARATQEQAQAQQAQDSHALQQSELARQRAQELATAQRAAFRERLLGQLQTLHAASPMLQQPAAEQLSSSSPRPAASPSATLLQSKLAQLSNLTIDIPHSFDSSFAPQTPLSAARQSSPTMSPSWSHSPLPSAATTAAEAAAAEQAAAALSQRVLEGTYERFNSLHRGAATRLRQGTPRRISSVDSARNRSNVRFG